MAYCLPVIGQLIVDSPAEMKLKALQVVEHLLSMPVSSLRVFSGFKTLYNHIQCIFVS